MEEHNAIAWLGRKIGWGFVEGQRAAWEQLGPAAVIDELVDPDQAGRQERVDPFDGIDFDPESAGRAGALGVFSWVEHAATSPRPLETFMEFFWSDYFGVSMRSVRPQPLMFAHMNLLGVHALGNFSELLRAVTIDAAMLRFLDGDSNTAVQPNENYGRELLELYSVGVGNFGEDDVKGAARALTGWAMRRFDLQPRFVPSRHDDDPQTVLGVDGVHDVDSLIDAVLSQPATASRVVDKIATAILGPDYDSTTVAAIAAEFGETWELRPVVRSLLTLAVEGEAKPSVLEPLPWYATVRKFTQIEPRPKPLADLFRGAGQIPLQPPNVGGFPHPESYLSTASTIARFNFASFIARQVRTSDRVMSLSEDIDDLAYELGLVDGFLPASRLAIGRLDPGVDRVAAALASPDLVVV